MSVIKSKYSDEHNITNEYIYIAIFPVRVSLRFIEATNIYFSVYEKMEAICLFPIHHGKIKLNPTYFCTKFWDIRSSSCTWT